jgi:hypothetical protein
MAVFLEDVSPHEMLHTALPHTTSDDLTKHNLLAVAVLERFLRHAEGYGMTLTKLIAEAGKDGPRESQISRAYNCCIERGYLGRIEYSHSRPSGESGNGGQRATYAFVSRVPLSEERLSEVVRRYTPGRYVLVAVDSGTTDERGRPVYEQRRVRVLAAEIYCAKGAFRIGADGELSEHTKRRGRPSTAPRAARPREAKPLVTPEPENPGSGVTSTNAEDHQVTPEPENPGSGVTSTNAEDHQVAPEPENPGSIKKTNEKTNVEEDQAGGPGPAGPPAPPGRIENVRSAAEGRTDQLRLVGDPDTRAGNGLLAAAGFATETDWERVLGSEVAAMARADIEAALNALPTRRRKTYGKPRTGRRPRPAKNGPDVPQDGLTVITRPDGPGAAAEAI